MATSYGITLEGGKRIINLMASDDLLVKPVKNMLKAVGMKGRDVARSAAPRGRTGGVAKHIGYRVTKKGVAIRAYDPRLVHSKGHGTSNLSRFLEWSTKHHHRGWLMQAMQQVMGQLSGALRQGADEIERTWRAGR